MLGKLIKNEFAATSKTYLPLYALLLVLTAINKVFMYFRSDDMNLPQGLALSAYVMVIMAIMVMTVVLTIQRFSKNILGDEGYLMHTLPVQKWQLTTSKLVVAMAWTVVAIVVSTLSIALLAYNQSFINLCREMMFFLRDMFQYITPWELTCCIFYTVVLSVLGLAMSYLPVYFAMALGYMSSKNKFLASVAWFIGLSFALQCVATVGIIIIDKFEIWRIFSGIQSQEGVVHLIMWCLILATLAIDAVCFFGTNYILKNKLNLE